MSETWTFWVYVIKAHDRVGFLLKRQAAPHGVVEARYFVPPTAEGLELDDQILQAHGCRRETLSPKSRDEARILDLFKQCADFISRQEGAVTSIPLAQVYQEKKDYVKATDSLFHKSNGRLRNEHSTLRTFLIHQEVFKASVLKKRGNEDTLDVRAREIAILTPDDLRRQKERSYLRRIEDILRIDDAEPAVWFRDNGPIAADFAAGRVFRRGDRVAQLKEQVASRPFFLLHGPSAAGKSIIVRTLANDLREKQAVHYFSCAEDRYFKRTDLLDEIRLTDGLVIIEDIHLAPDRIDYVLSRLEGGRHPAILCTSRHATGDNRFQHCPALLRIPSTELRPWEDADQLIDEFTQSESLPALSPDVRQALESMCLGSYFYLARALMAYGTHGEDIQPSQWLAEGIRDDLNRLEKLKSPTEQYAWQYPQVLLALAPLYRYEVLTAETFLTHKLGLPKDALNELVARCEITRQETPEGDVLYGLRHSGIADAYCQYGMKYRTAAQPATENAFLEDYARADTPNGLEAIVRADLLETREAILNNLRGDGALCDIIERERTLRVVSDWMLAYPDAHSTQEDIRRTIARRISTTEDLSAATLCLAALGAGGHDLVDWESVGRNISAGRNISGATVLLVSLWSSPSTAETLCSYLDPTSLSRLINDVGEPFWLSHLLRAIHAANPTLGKTLFAAVEWERVAEQVNNIEKPDDVVTCIANFSSCREDVGGVRHMCRRLNMEKLAERLLNYNYASDVGICLHVIRAVDEDIAKYLCSQFPPEVLAAQLSPRRWRGFGGINECVIMISQLMPVTSERTVGLLESKNCAMRLSLNVDEIDGWEVLDTIARLYPAKAADIVSAMDMAWAATGLRATPRDHMKYVIGILRRIDGGRCAELRRMFRERVRPSMESLRGDW